jgi:hypothetical protein
MNAASRPQDPTTGSSGGIFLFWRRRRGPV